MPVRIEMKPEHYRALGDILRGSAVAADLRRRGERIAAAAGPGHVVESSVGRNRARVAVITETHAARWAEAKRRTLTAAVGAGRG